jgi:hypothetical protein
MVFLMSSEDKLIGRIRSAGSAGIKKTDLRKEFGELELDVVLEKLVTRGNIFVDKKGSAYYCWHKEYYLQNLLNTDPRFKITYEAIKSLESTVNVTSDALARNMEILANNISNLAKLVVEKSERMSCLPAPSTQGAQKSPVNLDDFRKEFDLAISSQSSSIGWTELSAIRNHTCQTLGISSEQFYQLAKQLVDQHQDRYELSTGGAEGVMVRGLVHGFVRCITQ